MNQGTGELSDKAGNILTNFMGRCRQSATQGVHRCDTESVAEDHTMKVTPVEPEYLFGSQREADAVSRHLQSMLGQEGFDAIDVRVVPMPPDEDAFRIHIRAEW